MVIHPRPAGNPPARALKRGLSTDPEHACPEVRLGREVVEQQAGFAHHLRDLEAVSHQQEHVHIIRFGLSSHEGSKYNQSREVAGAARSVMNTFQPKEYESALGCFGAETVANLR